MKLPHKKYKEIRRIVYRYYTGTISGPEFERLMRRLGYTRAQAYRIYRDVLEERIEIELTGIHFAMSIEVYPGRGDSRERHFEGWLRTLLPSDLIENFEKDLTKLKGEEKNIIFCSDVKNVAELYHAAVYTYFESKGYDIEMLFASKSVYRGVQYLTEDEVRKLFEGKEMAFVMDIFDYGSGTRKLNIHRWHDVIEVPKFYWEDVVTTCKVFRRKAFEIGYAKSTGKGLRWQTLG